VTSSTCDCTPLAGENPPLAEEPATPRTAVRILLKKTAGNGNSSFHFDENDLRGPMRREKWMVRAAVVGGAVSLIAAGLFWLVLTQPVAVAQVLDRAF
jgi:hypothetical protein